MSDDWDTYAPIPYVPADQIDDEPAVEYEPPPFLEIERVAAALHHTPEPAQPYVDRLIRPGEACVIAAPRAIGKSWIAMQLALSIARGSGKFLGHIPVVRAGRVLLAHGELLPAQAARRWARLLGDEPAPDGLYQSYAPWRVRVLRRRIQRPGGITDDLAHAELDEALVNTVAAANIDVLVIDPWRVFYAGAENSNDETEAALNELTRVATQHQVALVLLHHVGKTTDVREPEDLWRGASRLADWASSRVTLLPALTAKQAEERGLSRAEARRIVRAEFLTRDEPLEPVVARLDPHTGWWAPHDPGDTTVAGLYGRRWEVAGTVEACERTGPWTSVRAAADGLGTGRRNAEALLQAAVAAGELVARSHGARTVWLTRRQAAQADDGDR